MTRAEVVVRAEAARKFFEVAELVAEDDVDDSLPAVCGALAVLAGIAAGDAIAGHVLRQRPRGQDHAQAVEVLAGIRGAEHLTSALARLLADKDASQYGTTYLTRDRARAMVRRARTILEGMEVLLREGASSQPPSS